MVHSGTRCQDLRLVPLSNASFCTEIPSIPLEGKEKEFQDYPPCSCSILLEEYSHPVSLCPSCCGSLQVARYCLQGFRAAIDDNCNDACSNGGTIRSFIVDNRLDQTCSHALEDRPRPLCHDSCVQGYRAGVEDTLIALAKIIPQVNEPPHITAMPNMLCCARGIPLKRNTAKVRSRVLENFVRDGRVS